MEKNVPNTIHFPELLKKKRDGGEFTAEELKWLIQEIVERSVESSQIGAMLMAMYIRGLSDQETMDLTRVMVDSGEVLEWRPEWQDKLVDKHSTGGCGDKVSLVLAPALSACGFKVPMLSGRSLGHTGGTLDKLESIPGSIISKKVAAGTKLLVMDVKVGSAAFFKTVDGARNLASKLVRLGLDIRAAITRMDVPIGRMVGNSLEVAEAIECMKGNGPEDLVELVTTLGVSLPNKNTIHRLVCKVRETDSAFTDKKQNRKRTVLTEGMILVPVSNNHSIKSMNDGRLDPQMLFCTDEAWFHLS
ncbi:Thymidine phosphorylase [Blattella germanica]|nr:Thymidine phosphorylase [Blattella germanica]